MHIFLFDEYINYVFAKNIFGVRLTRGQCPTHANPLEIFLLHALALKNKSKDTRHTAHEKKLYG